MARRFDIFNGDADGLCALHQLRLVEPAETTLITGVKRDTKLLARANAQKGDLLTVLDIGLAQNRDVALQLLEAGVKIRWFDHHHAGEPLAHQNLDARIDHSHDVCTAILVNRQLEGRHRPWAIAAAFGDGLAQPAIALAKEIALDGVQIAALRHLGECLNYNAYGETLADLFCHPATLYAEMKHYTDPWQFRAESQIFGTIAQGYSEDMALATGLSPLLEQPNVAAWLLPDTAWSRRVSGPFASALAQRHVGRALAILTHNSGSESIRVSLRVPAAAKLPADAFCRQFPGGGGRATAAGIDTLSAPDLDDFLKKLCEAYA